jgi:hypothetical protein
VGQNSAPPRFAIFHFFLRENRSFSLQKLDLINLFSLMCKFTFLQIPQIECLDTGESQETSIFLFFGFLAPMRNPKSFKILSLSTNINSNLCCYTLSNISNLSSFWILENRTFEELSFQYEEFFFLITHNF